MIVAMEDGLVHPNDVVETGSGRMPMYGRIMTDHNWDKGGYHTLTAAKSIQNSSNIGVSSLIDQHYKNNPLEVCGWIVSVGS